MYFFEVFNTCKKLYELDNTNSHYTKSKKYDGIYIKYAKLIEVNQNIDSKTEFKKNEIKITNEDEKKNLHDGKFLNLALCFLKFEISIFLYRGRQ